MISFAVRSVAYKLMIPWKTITNKDMKAVYPA